MCHTAYNDFFFFTFTIFDRNKTHKVLIEDKGFYKDTCSGCIMPVTEFILR